MELKESLKHPATGMAVIFGALGQLSIGFIEPVWSLVASTATYWFPALATAGATILPEFGYESFGTQILLVAAIVFVAVQLDKLGDRIAEWRQKR